MGVLPLHRTNFLASRRAFFQYQEKQRKTGAAFLAAILHHDCMFQRHPIQNQQTMFITTNTQSRMPIFGNAAYARIAVETFYNIQHFYPFFLYAFVIMPDHCHLLLNMPEGGSVSKMIGVYKRAVSFNIGQGSIWQSRFHIVVPKNIEATIEYIYQNPVKAGLCENAEEYPWSSASGRWDLSEFEMI